MLRLDTLEAAGTALGLTFLCILLKRWLRNSCVNHNVCTWCWIDDELPNPTPGYSPTPARANNPNQTADIWNISGRVNQEGGPITSEPHRWPTHDHHVTMSSFIVSENQPKRDRIPPPPYCEVDLPTYEQATGVAAPKNEVPSVHITPSSSRTLDGPTS